MFRKSQSYIIKSKLSLKNSDKSIDFHNIPRKVTKSNNYGRECMTRLLLFPLSSLERQQSGKEYKGKGISSYTGCRSKKSAGHAENEWMMMKREHQTGGKVRFIIKPEIIRKRYFSGKEWSEKKMKTTVLGVKSPLEVRSVGIVGAGYNVRQESLLER